MMAGYEASDSRRHVARAEPEGAATSQRQAVLERIRAEAIEIPRLEPGTLALRAVEHRARTERERRLSGGAAGGTRGTSPAPPAISPMPARGGSPPVPADRSALDPWKVGYLLHRLSHDDRLLDGLSGTGRAEAMAVLRQRICAAIAEAYPALAEEYVRQASGPAMADRPDGDGRPP
jgi:hypothetical protein